MEKAVCSTDLSLFDLLDLNLKEKIMDYVCGIHHEQSNGKKYFKNGTGKTRRFYYHSNFEKYLAYNRSIRDNSDWGRCKYGIYDRLLTHGYIEKPDKYDYLPYNLWLKSNACRLFKSFI